MVEAHLDDFLAFTATLLQPGAGVGRNPSLPPVAVSARGPRVDAHALHSACQLAPQITSYVGDNPHAAAALFCGTERIPTCTISAKQATV